MTHEIVLSLAPLLACQRCCLQSKKTHTAQHYKPCNVLHKQCVDIFH
uniref:Uncharacterized protein MANES_14G038700 n=1 Tax=Rhizophora mucronata TaxID=61149 RepID=A0A2P2JAU4_RHIMU